ncbi:hypothetical protein BC831DRAFT_550416 [Entophlyctis helioformis]|nr:hypothetical protein BC831DRAFT_550416 [Entophlyctis helioformis]
MSACAILNSAFPALFPDAAQCCSPANLVACDASNNVITLTLNGQSLSGALPESLGGITSLKTLNLKDNAYNSTIPASFGNLANLEILNLENNKLVGTFPASIGQLTKLKELRVRDNTMSGPIPNGFVSVTLFSFARNNLCVPADFVGKKPTNMKACDAAPANPTATVPAGPANPTATVPAPQVTETTAPITNPNPNCDRFNACCAWIGGFDC